MTAINSATGFECSISCTGSTKYYGKYICQMVFNNDLGSKTYSFWQESASDQISFPFGTTSIQITQGPTMVAASLTKYSSGTATVYGMNPTYTTANCSISAKGSGKVKITAPFKAVTSLDDNSSSYVATIDEEYPYIIFNISSGNLTSIESNIVYTARYSMYIVIDTIYSISAI